jgi:hypothetical protein
MTRKQKARAAAKAASRKAARVADAPLQPRLSCALCGRLASSMDFCHGCQAVICMECNTVCVDCGPMPSPPHKPEWHQDWAHEPDCDLA